MGLLDFISNIFKRESLQDPLPPQGCEPPERPLDSMNFSEELSLIPSCRFLHKQDNIDTPFCIPPDTLDLLLFVDGPHQNYVRGMLVAEPSLISVELPIGEPVSPAPPLGYYPSYRKLSPDERATYLNWLCNVDNPIDIGYVFIFYYGLERILLDYPQKWEKALRMIYRLRQVHHNSSFLAYSHDAITAICLVKKRFDLFEDYIQTTGNIISEAKLAYMAGHDMGLTTRDIILLAPYVGFKNHRYIKQHPIQFERTLHGILESRYKDAKYPLTPKILQEAPLGTGCHFANYSLENRAIDIPDILNHPDVQKDLYDMLIETHNSIKKIPMKQRL